MQYKTTFNSINATSSESTREKSFSLPVISKLPLINQDVVLFSLNWYREKDPRIPLGMAFIASYVERTLKFTSDHGIDFIQLDVRKNVSRKVHEILVQDPDILGIGVFCWNIEIVKKVLRSLRTHGFQGKIVLGGSEITYCITNPVSEFPEADYFVKGDGEQAMVDIIVAEQRDKEIDKSGIFTNQSTTYDSVSITPTDRLVSPYRVTRISSMLLGNDHDNFVRWQTQRGCLYRCSFCSFPNGYKKLHEMKFEEIIHDLTFFAKNDVKEVAVLDPIFFVDKDRAMKILQLIEQIIPDCRFEIQTKIEHLNEELLDQIAELNIALECGIQTLDPKVQKVIRRVNNREKIISNLEAIKSRNIEIEAHLIIGLPYQTVESLREDYNLLQNYTQNIRLFPLMRLRGTRLDQDLEQKDWGKHYQFSDFHPREVLATPWIASAQLLKLKERGEDIL